MLSRKALQQRRKNPRSLRSERFSILRKLREVTERESSEGVTAMEVSGSLSLVGVSGGREGNVVGETRESGGGEGNVVGETRESESPIKKHKINPPFVIETPDRKHLAEFPDEAFVGQTSQVQAFVDQVNATSSCVTLGCTGLLKPTSDKLTGLGRAVDIDYDCTGCSEHQLTFSSSALSKGRGQNVVHLALQSAFIAAGCSYVQDETVWHIPLVCQWSVLVSFTQLWS